MTIAHLAGSAIGADSRPPGLRQGSNRSFAIGSQVELYVLRELQDSVYLVQLGDSRKVVSSTISLQPGSTVHATVAHAGQKLELRYLGAQIAETDAGAETEVTEAGNDPLQQIEARYAIGLSEADRQTLLQAIQQSDRPETMAAGGAFLAKLSLPLHRDALAAMQAVQLWNDHSVHESHTGDVAHETEKPAQLPGRDIAQLAQLIDRATGTGAALQSGGAGSVVVPGSPEAIQPRGATSTAGDMGSDGRDHRSLAYRLLNVQDEGSLAYRYGVLPVLIANQLVELELVYFRERREAERPAGVRRLVMSLATANLGRVEVLAHALGDRVKIGIRTESSESSEALSAHIDELRDLITRLGWNVEAITYDWQLAPEPAARSIVEHVLNADTLSRLI